MSQTPPSHDAEKLARQVRLLKIALAALFAVLVVGGIGFVYVRHVSQPVAILLDGKAVTNAPNISAANNVLHEAEATLTRNAYPSDAIVRLQTVQLERLNGDVPIDTEGDARSKLCKKLKLHVRGYAIVVDGTPALVLPTDSAAADTLHKVKEHFAQMPPLADIVGEPEFVEKVSVQQAAVDVSEAFGSANDAAPVFYAPVAGKTVTVKRGDTGLLVAIRNHISLNGLRESNPNVNLDRLRVGDKLNVQKGAARLSVRVQKQFSRDEPVMTNVPPAEAGLRRVTYVVTFVNGAEQKRDVENINVITPPRARTVL